MMTVNLEMLNEEWC